MKRPSLIILLISFLLFGCQESADDFFSGRPSEMSLVHGRIIGGPPETMLVLLKIPARFPDATLKHISNWQGSVIAWWIDAEKHNLMVESFSKISHNEMLCFKEWISVRYRFKPQEANQVLDQIEAYLNAAPYTHPRTN
jgi:hypothetical protein